MASRLKHMRVTQNMTITELSELSCLSFATISAIENSRRIPSIQVLRILANILQIPVAYLGCFDSLPEHVFSEKIKKTRLYMGLTKKEFSDILGVNVRTIFGWESGMRKPTLHSLEILQPFFDILRKD